jgi:hypothetical protein
MPDAGRETRFPQSGNAVPNRWARMGESGFVSRINGAINRRSTGTIRIEDTEVDLSSRIYPR